MLAAVCFLAVVAAAASPALAYANVDSSSNVAGLEENPSKLLSTLGLPKDISVQALRDLAMLRAEEEVIFLHSLPSLQSVSRGPQGLHAGFGRPTKQALAMASHSMLLEFATIELKKKDRGRFGNAGLDPRQRRKKRQIDFSLNPNNFNNFFNNFFSRGIFNTNFGGAPTAPVSSGSGRSLGSGDLNANSLSLSSNFGGVFFVPSPASSSSSSSSRPSVNSSLESFFDAFACQAERTESECDVTAPYRTFSGRCNNLALPINGKSLLPFARLIPAEYDDGVHRPRRRSVLGGPLANVRAISTVAHPGESHLDTKHTLILMQWAQILDHDITFTPMVRGFNDSILDCRSCESNGRHRACYPILVPTGDPYFPITEDDTNQRKCLPFTRSLPGQRNLGPREQLNQNTAYLDASMLYGSSPCRMLEIRKFEGGRMKWLDHPQSRSAKSLMPRNNENKECRSSSGLCFHTGDDRSNEQPGLAATHTLLLREHNRLADLLEAVNPHWDDERIFQETRKIIAAKIQHITYNEFLPRVLGPDVMSRYDLNLRHLGSFYTDYDSTCAADITNEFATAAFRFGHTLIRPFLTLMKNVKGRGRQAEEEVMLRDHFHNPDVVYHADFIDEVMTGLSSQPMEQFDPEITNEVTNHLFEEKNKPFSGLDLVALNLQRGREHGIPSYTAYRQLCQKSWGRAEKIRSFVDLAAVVGKENAARLEKAYGHVDDIDLFTGGLSEPPMAGAVVGETFACIIGEQFGRLRRCDRFWFESSNSVVRFAPQQLDEIRNKTTLAGVICTNCDSPAEMQRSVFDIEDPESNPRQACPEDINVGLWKEQP